MYNILLSFIYYMLKVTNYFFIKTYNLKYMLNNIYVYIYLYFNI